MLSPGLSMLWESVEAERALPERFGFEDRLGAARWLTAVLAEHWGLAVQDVPRLTLSDHNAIAWVTGDRGPLIVKFSRAEDRFAHLAATTHLLARLAAEGIPVAAPLPARDGTVRIETDGPSGPLSLAVLPEVDGAWLDVTDLHAVHTAGACLAALHTALALVDVPGLPREAPRSLPGRLAGWLADRDPGRVPAASAFLADRVAELPAPEGPPQLIHGDYRSANLLVRGGEIAAVLDFDEVRRDHRVADLAQASTYLATLFRDWGPTPAPARAALRAGYESVRPLSAQESGWLEALTLWMGIAAIPPGDDGRWATAVDQLLSGT
jgi:homoserine kinase type II